MLFSSGGKMARETLDRKINILIDQILILDSMVEEAILQAVDALKKQDLVNAERVYNNDKGINTKRYELENDCITIIATQQPIMAHDLRLLASILEVAAELERMGDYAKGIATICIRIGKQPLIKPLVDIPRMAELSVSMLHRAIGAFVNGEIETARLIPKEDDLVDHLYNQVYRELITIMLSNPATIDQANYLTWVAHNLERVADRVTNICERTIYTHTGELIEIDTSDDESWKDAGAVI
jgi:phosphate transport system protein